ncbi:MAG TPA: CBS domain-containing protein [Chloroflexota bacterium]
MSTGASSSSATAGHEPREPWRRPISEFLGLVHLAPPVNHPQDALAVVVEAFSRDPGAGAIFVVDTDDRLLGWIREQALDADLVTLVLPQQLWSAVEDMDTRAVLRAARGPRLTARDLMGKVRSITPETMLADAVGVMTRSHQSVAPLVDSQGRLLGYVRLLELLAHLLRST